MKNVPTYYAKTLIIARIAATIIPTPIDFNNLMYTGFDEISRQIKGTVFAIGLEVLVFGPHYALLVCHAVRAAYPPDGSTSMRGAS